MIAKSRPTASQMDPQREAKTLQDRPKIDAKMQSNFASILVSIFVQFWADFGSKNGPKMDPKSDFILHVFSKSVLELFESTFA